MDTSPEDYDEKVAEYWDKHTDDTFRGETYWLANEVIVERFNKKAAGNRHYTNWVDFLVEHFIGERRPLDRVLTIGCGDGALDRHLVQLITAKQIDGIDIAPNRIDIARRAAIDAGMQDTINYVICNAETTDFPAEKYDAIFFNSSLHHMSELDSLLARCARSLKRNGYLFINEYIGPSRYRFSDREKQVMQSVFQMLPPRYRISHDEHDRGKVRDVMGFPDPAEVEKDDPSEAIRSEEIVPALTRYFDIEEFNVPGGTLQQFLFHGIAGNFTRQDAYAMQLLETIWRIEDMLVENGDIPPHFAIMVLRPMGFVSKVKQKFREYRDSRQRTESTS